MPLPQGDILFIEHLRDSMRVTEADMARLNLEAAQSEFDAAERVFQAASRRLRVAVLQSINQSRGTGDNQRKGT